MSTGSDMMHRMKVEGGVIQTQQRGVNALVVGVFGTNCYWYVHTEHWYQGHHRKRALTGDVPASFARDALIMRNCVVVT